MRLDRAADRRKPPQALRTDLWAARSSRKPRRKWLFAVLAVAGLCAAMFVVAGVLTMARQRAAEEAATRNLQELRLEADRFQREMDDLREAIDELPTEDPRLTSPDAELSPVQERRVEPLLEKLGPTIRDDSRRR
jgi:hypothetical protein